MGKMSFIKKGGLFIIAFNIWFGAISQTVHTDEQLTIDSLARIINNPSTDDTLLAKSYVSLSELLFVENVDTVIPMSEKAISIIEKSLQENPSPTIKKSLLISYTSALNNIAYIHDRKGNYNAAIAFYKKSKEIIDITKNGNDLYNYYQNIGWVYEWQGNIIYALELYHKSLKVAEKEGNEKNISGALNNIGLIYLRQKDYATALKYYKKSVKINEKMGNNEEAGTMLDGIGSVYYQQENYTKAIQYYTKAILLHLKNRNKFGLQTSYNNMGAVYDHLKENDKSLEYYLKGIEIQQNGNLQRELANSYVNIASVYFAMGKKVKSRNYAEKGMDLAQKNGAPYLISFAAQTLSTLDAEEGNYKRSLELYQLHVLMRDSIKNDKNLRATTRREAQYNFEKEEAIIKSKLLISNEASKTKTVGIIGISILLLMISIYAYVILKKKQKEQTLNRILAASNEVIELQKVKLEQDVVTLQKGVKTRKQEADSYYFTQSAINVKFEDIVLLESSGNYVLIHTSNKKTPLLERIKMVKLIPNFPSDIFVQAHRSYYVNLNQIVSRPTKYLIKMSNEIDVNVSRSYVDNLGDKFLT